MTTKKETDTFDLSADDKISLGLLKHSIHFLDGDITNENITETIKWIVYENSMFQEQKTLTLYINSDGGYLSGAFALIDIMKKSRHTIRTIGLGSIASAAFLIFSAGTKGHRYIAKNTSIMCHQFSGGVEGKYHDIEAQMRENKLTNDRMIDVLKETTVLDVKKIKSKLLPPSDVWLTPQELINYGIADHIFN